MPPTSVIAIGDGAVPRGFVVAASEVLQLLAMSASFDGTGAAGAFLPAVGIYSQDNRLLSRTFTDGEVAAGSSAEATFAPF